MENTSTLNDVSSTTRPGQPNGAEPNPAERPWWATQESDISASERYRETFYEHRVSGPELPSPLGTFEPRIASVEFGLTVTEDLTTGEVERSVIDASLTLHPPLNELVQLQSAAQCLELAALLEKAADWFVIIAGGNASDARRDRIERVIAEYGEAAEARGWLMGRHGDADGNLPEAVQPIDDACSHRCQVAFKDAVAVAGRS